MTDYTFVIGKYAGEKLEQELTALLCRTQSVAAAGFSKKKPAAKILPPLLALLGVYLIVQGAMKKSPGFLAVGVLAIMGGFCYFWLNRPESGMRALAKQLLSSLNAIESSSRAAVLFDDEGATIRAKNNEVKIAYDDVAAAGASERLFILIHDRAATVLQKCDLVAGSAEAFEAYLREKTTKRFVTLEKTF